DQNQTQGDQEQQQAQQHGDQDLNQTQGDQEQQQAQKHGDQDQILGDQTQNQLQDQEDHSVQIQSQEHGDQTNGHQFNEGHINTSPLENYQTISTPVDVKGVSVNVNCGGYTPVPYGILHK